VAKKLRRGNLRRLGSRDWPAEYDDVFSVPASMVQRRAWRDVFGEEYPEGVATTLDVRERRVFVVAERPG
jgi:hypothetical protein